MRRFINYVKRGIKKRKGGQQQPLKQSKGAISNQAHQLIAQGAATQVSLRDQAAKAQPASSATLQVALVNRTSSSNVYAYITGQALNNNSALFLLQSDGQTPYYPTSPSSTGQPLQTNVGITLGAPGTTRTVTIPQIAGGRIWFSVDRTLTFLLNPGPSLVEPSVTNPSDPNINVSWGFAEFTWSTAQLYANITYVDFVSIPIALQLTNTSGATQNVSGMRSNGLDTVCSQLEDQSNKDGVAGWRNLIVSYNGKVLRTLSPNNGILLRPDDFSNYWEPYVNQVWQTYTTQPFNVKAEGVTASGNISTANGQLTLNGEGFNKPSTVDIFSSNTGPFATGGDQIRNQLIPQLAAAFNRSTLLVTNQTPAPVSDFYTGTITNHYSRIIHTANVDGKGYAFPYDDVPPSEGGDQSGYVNDASPQLLTVTVGGQQYN